MELFLNPVMLLLATAKDVFPVLGLLVLFQMGVLKRPIPRPGRIIFGFFLVLVGMACFLGGLDLALFPVGRTMALQLATSAQGDGGNIWEAQNSGTTNIIWDVYFVNPTTGWIVGDNGLISKYSTPVSVDDRKPGSTLNKFSLDQNYPNPFNPATTIEYSIPENGLVKLIVTNAIGEEVATLVNEFKDAGNYKSLFNAFELSSGIYFYSLQTGDFFETRKMLLLK